MTIVQAIKNGPKIGNGWNDCIEVDDTLVKIRKKNFNPNHEERKDGETPGDGRNTQIETGKGPGFGARRP